MHAHLAGRPAGRAALAEIITNPRETGGCRIATRGEIAATVTR